MSQANKDRILELASGYIERALTADEMSEFETLLEASPENRAVYLDYMETHALLQQRQMGESVQDDIAAFEEEYRPRRFPSLWQTFAALAIISLFALVLIRPPAADGTFAEMTKTESARWESSTLPTSDGARLGAGKLNLVRGLATIVFDSGAEVILEAPANLELVDSMNCVLNRGTAVAEVSESAQGFMIKTPTADVIDHGTRFAVNVDQTSKATRTQVFEGLVEVKLPYGDTSIELTTGQENFVAENHLGEMHESVEEATWTHQGSSATRGAEWKIITTADPGGQDAYVWAGRPNDHNSDELLLLKNSSDFRGPHRKAYLQFNLADIKAGQIEVAEIKLRFAPTGWGLASHVKNAEFLVYGLTDDALDNWKSDSLIWEEAGPAEAFKQVFGSLLVAIAGYLVMNIDKYNSLDAAGKAAVDKHSGEAFARRAGKAWDLINSVGKKDAEAAGNKIVTASDALVDEVKRLNKVFEADYVKDAASVGVDGAAILKFFRAEVSKMAGN